MFTYVYPGYKSNIPAWVPEHLMALAKAEFDREEENVDVTRGPMISRFSFTIDVREWGFADPRSELVREVRTRPEVVAIAQADVWDERSEDRPEHRHEDRPEPGTNVPAEAAVASAPRPGV
jgi:hypothetical protein